MAERRMKTYQVYLPIYISFTVEAKDEDEANERAHEKATRSYIREYFEDRGCSYDVDSLAMLEEVEE